MGAERRFNNLFVLCSLVNTLQSLPRRHGEPHSSPVASSSQVAVEGNSDAVVGTLDIPKTPSKRPNEEVETEAELPTRGTKRLRTRKNAQKGRGKTAAE